MVCEIKPLECAAILSGLLRERDLALEELESAQLENNDNLSVSFAEGKIKRVSDAFDSLEQCGCGF